MFGDIVWKVGVLVALFTLVFVLERQTTLNIVLGGVTISHLGFLLALTFYDDLRKDNLGPMTRKRFVLTHWSWSVPLFCLYFYGFLMNNGYAPRSIKLW